MLFDDKTQFSKDANSQFFYKIKQIFGQFHCTVDGSSN